MSIGIEQRSGHIRKDGVEALQMVAKGRSTQLALQHAHTRERQSMDNNKHSDSTHLSLLCKQDLCIELFNQRLELIDLCVVVLDQLHQMAAKNTKT